MYIIKYSTALKKKLDFNWREHLSVARDREKERKTEREDTSGVPLDRWNYSSFLQSENFRFCERRCEESLSLCLSLFPLTLHSRELPSSSPPSSLPFCFATWWKVFIVASPDSRLVFSSFFRQVRSARKWGATAGGEEDGTLSAASPRLRKTPTRLRERRFDKDQTERTEENNWSAFVWIAGERTTLPKEFLLSRYLWPLLWSNRPLATAFILPHYVEYVRSICCINNIVNFSICS